MPSFNEDLAKSYSTALRHLDEAEVRLSLARRERISIGPIDERLEVVIDQVQKLKKLMESGLKDVRNG